jgi:hypothetical protein
MTMEDGCIAERMLEMKKIVDERVVPSSKDLLSAEVGVIVSQFMAFMQTRSVWPCRLFIGDDPQKLNVDELLALLEEFKTTLKGI